MVPRPTYLHLLAAALIALAFPGPAHSQTTADDSADRARRGEFDATAEVPCAQERGQALGICSARVARSTTGAAVVVTFPNGFTRSLYFADGQFLRADATMSGTGRDTDWRIEDGHHVIRVDDQRYELPDTFVLGR